MMKLFERHDLATPETLPEIPEGVTVPDDISGLDITDGHRGGTRVRWLRWAAPVALVAAGAVAAVVAINDDGTKTGEIHTKSATELVQQSIDDALADMRTSDAVPSGSPFDAEVAPTTRNSAAMVQQAIDDALAEMNGS